MKSLFAKHFSGGNYFDDLRINIGDSIKAQEPWLDTIAKKKILRRSFLSNYARFAAYIFLKRFGLWDIWINTGFVNDWYKEFVHYWSNSLQGRSLSIIDFHHLRFHYRIKFQQMGSLAWDTPLQHIENWQDPKDVYLILHFVYKYALDRARNAKAFMRISNNSHILEYGCSIAPAYRTWKRYFNHIDATWVLADIPCFSFHYARHTYAEDEPVQFCLITEDKFDEPLKGHRNFDSIFVQEVFEHLDQPRHIAEYLLDRLNPDGLFIFDYIISDAIGHDTANGLQQRQETLRYLQQHLEIIEGDFHIDNRSLKLCIGRKK